jgi:hypothetical protein
MFSKHTRALHGDNVYSKQMDAAGESLLVNKRTSLKYLEAIILVLVFFIRSYRSLSV